MLTSETCIVDTTIDHILQRRICSKSIESDWRADSKNMVLQAKPYQLRKWTLPTSHLCLYDELLQRLGVAEQLVFNSLRILGIHVDHVRMFQNVQCKNMKPMSWTVGLLDN